MCFITCFWKDLQQKIVVFPWAFSMAICIFTLQISSSSLLGAEIIDISIIPTDGKIGEAFRTGDFSFEIILLYGMYLMKLMAILAGSLYVVMNVYAGMQYVLSDWSGIASKEAGKNTLINAFLGFAVTVCAWIIIDTVTAFFLES